MDRGLGDRGERLQHEVAVAHRVEAVGRGGSEAEIDRERLAIDFVGGAGERRAAQRTDRGPDTGIREPAEVPSQHLDVGETPVGEEDGLGSLKVGVPGEHRLSLAMGEVDEAGDDRLDLVDACIERGHRPEPEIRRHLIVAAAAGVKFLAQLPDPFDEVPLHEGMDVLVVRVAEDRGIGRDVVMQRLERGFQMAELDRVEHAGPFQRPRPGRGSRDVLGKEAAIEGKRIVEPLEQFMDLPAEASAPDRLRDDRRVGGAAQDSAPAVIGSGVPFPSSDCIAAIRLGSEKSRMNPSACDWS